MARYDKRVAPYLNTTPELDDAVFSLLDCWKGGDVDMDSAMRNFFRACSITPNIGRFKHYVPHCLQVSRRCEKVGGEIIENSRFLAEQLELNKLAFMGLIEDSVYLIGGNGNNNPNTVDSNPYHEILTFIQMQYRGLDELANGMAMHGISPEISALEEGQKRFSGVSPTGSNIALDALTGVDFLCNRDYLPDTHGSYEDCLKFRIYGGDGIRERRAPNHPLIVGLNNGCEERLRNILGRIYKMETGEISQEEVRKLYKRK